jgi:hypothetical protein
MLLNSLISEIFIRDSNIPVLVSINAMQLDASKRIESSCTHPTDGFKKREQKIPASVVRYRSSIG